jgi:hypothetical protein
VLQLTTFRPSKTVFPDDTEDISYYVELEYTTGATANDQKAMLDSGLVNNDAFPVWCEGGLSSTAKTVKLIDDTKDAIRMGTFGAFGIADTASCYYPVGSSGNGGAGTYVLAVRGFYYLAADPRVKHIYYE